MTELVKIADVGHVRTITLNRPDRKNALSTELAWAVIGAVDEAAGEDGVLARTALPTKERSGDSPEGVHALLDVNRQREEVELILGLLARGGCGKQHGLVIEVCSDGACGLTRQPPRLEFDRARAERPIVDNGLRCGNLGTLHGCLPVLMYRGARV